jgi:hypothetical protein
LPEPEASRTSSALAMLALVFVLLFLCGSVAFVVLRVLPDSLSTPVEPIVLFGSSTATTAPARPATQIALPVVSANPPVITATTSPLPTVANTRPPQVTATIGAPASSATPTTPPPTRALPATPGGTPGGPQFRVSQVRYGLHPDRARIVIDLVAPANAIGNPIYTITNAGQKVTIRIAAGGAPWASEPRDAIVQTLQLAPAGSNAVDLIVETSVPVKRIADTVLSGPERLVFDLYP